MDEDKKKNKWKDRLFSSSLPLEFEVAKFLAGREYAVDFNYSYQRQDGGEQKEFSFDIQANMYYPFKWDSPIKMNFDLLIECKYRNPSVSWLFIPEINCAHHQESYLRNTIRFDDAFTFDHHEHGPFGLPVCESALKAMEVNISNGEVHESDITHGAYQLLFALPYFLERHVSRNLASDHSEMYPYLVCPILVTTAKLLLLKEDFSIKTLKESQDVLSLATEEPYLQLHTSLPPSFGTHCANIFNQIPNPHQVANYKKLLEIRKVKFGKNLSLPKSMYSQPDLRLWDYKNATPDLFSSVLVCNLDHFPKLIEEIENAVNFVGKGLRKIKVKSK